MLPATGVEETGGVTLGESGGERASEREARGRRVKRVRDSGEERGRDAEVGLFGGRICAVLGMLFAIGGIIFAISAGADGASISAGTIGVALGILAYFLGARRIGTLAVILSVAALFLGLAASQGLIPGMEASGRGLPDIESNAGEN